VKVRHALTVLGFTGGFVQDAGPVRSGIPTRAFQSDSRVLVSSAFDADQVKLLTPAEDRDFVFALYAPTP
jgi:hypothetical protein